MSNGVDSSWTGVKIRRSCRDRRHLKKTMVKLVFFRDVGFGDFGNWLGWLKSGMQFRGMLRVLPYLGNICLTCRIRIYKIDIWEVKI